MRSAGNTLFCGILCLAACSGPRESGQSQEPGEQLKSAEQPSTGQPAPGPEVRQAGERPADPADRPPTQMSDKTDTPAARTDVREDDARHSAEAKFTAAGSLHVEGEAEFREVPGGVQVEVEVEGLPPGPKGIHVHQKGDCSDIPGKSMGEHFAASDESHGLPTAPEHHLGDLGNIEIRDDKEGKLKITMPGVNLKQGDPRSLLGKAIVIHEAKDVGTGKSGESGTPVVCGVIQPD